VVELKDIVPGPSDDESTHPLSAAAFFLTHGVPPLPSGAPVGTSNEAAASMAEDDASASNDNGPTGGSVGPGRYCPPRHPTHFEPAFIAFNGML